MFFILKTEKIVFFFFPWKQENKNRKRKQLPNMLLVFWVCFLVVGLGWWIYGSLIFLFSLTDSVLENGTLSRSNFKLGLTSTMELYGPMKAANLAKIEDFDTSTQRLSLSGSKSQIFGHGFCFIWIWVLNFIWVCLNWEVVRTSWVWRDFAPMVFVCFEFF